MQRVFTGYKMWEIKKVDRWTGKLPSEETEKPYSGLDKESIQKSQWKKKKAPWAKYRCCFVGFSSQISQ